MLAGKMGRKEFLGTLGVLAVSPLVPRRRRVSRPNVLLIVTDDQPAHTVYRMPKTLAAFSGGLDLTKTGYTAMPMCGPARVTFLTGKYPHNHGVISNSDTFQRYVASGYPPEDLYSRMKDAGYQVAHFGKVVNGYGKAETRSWVHPAFSEWDRWCVLASAGQATPYAVNQDGEVSERTDNDTQFFCSEARRFVRSRVGEPWFAMLAPTTPHVPYTPIRDHAFDGAVYSSPGTEEEDLSDKSAWTASQPRQEPAEFQRRYEGILEELVTVDRWIGLIFDALRETGQLDNTLVIFTSDNGYFLGEHGGLVGKMRPHEESARVPFLIRGPGLPSSLPDVPLASHVDIPCTILSAAGADNWGLDGRDLRTMDAGQRRERVLCEHPRLGWWMVREGNAVYMDLPDESEELYDLSEDPYQLQNRLHEPTPEAETEASELSARLAALKDCSGDSCRTAEGFPAL